MENDYNSEILLVTVLLFGLKGKGNIFIGLRQTDRET
jgi:hypothetical protein